MTYSQPRSRNLVIRSITRSGVPVAEPALSFIAIMASAAPSPAAVAAAVAAASAGRVSFRADKGGVVHAPVGRVSFEAGALRQNVGALADALLSARPKALKGGGWSGYVKRVALSTTHGKGRVRVSLQSVVAAAAQAKAAAKK